MDKEKTRHRSVVSKNSLPTERWRGKTRNYPKYSQERTKMFSSTFRHPPRFSLLTHTHTHNRWVSVWTGKWKIKTLVHADVLRGCKNYGNWKISERMEMFGVQKGLIAFGKLGKFIVTLTQTIESSQSVSSVRFVFGKHEFSHYYVHTSLSSPQPSRSQSLLQYQRAVNKRKFSTSSCSFYLSVSVFLIFLSTEISVLSNFFTAPSVLFSAAIDVNKLKAQVNGRMLFSVYAGWKWWKIGGNFFICVK